MTIAARSFDAVRVGKILVFTGFSFAAVVGANRAIVFRHRIADFHTIVADGFIAIAFLPVAARVLLGAALCLALLLRASCVLRIRSVSSSHDVNLC
jgi:hypothetical protein